MRKYPFTSLEAGDKAFILGEFTGGKAYHAAHAAASRTGRQFNIHADDVGLHVECVAVDHPVMTMEGFIQSLIDWKAGVFSADLVTATEAAETIGDVTPTKAGILFSRMGLAKFTANGKTLWAVRNADIYSEWRARDIWNQYTKNPA